MEENILEIRRLSAAYDRKNVLRNVSLDVRKGETLCIVGESGSGKSTLLRTLCRDRRIQIRSGGFRFSGNRIGVIGQNPWGAFNPIRPLGMQLKETLASNSLPYEEEEICRLLDALGLEEGRHILKSKPCSLSGGMNQRIAIAAAFLLKPDLLLCDEITSSVDVTTGAGVIRELLKLKEQTGVTILFVTHHLGIAAHIADRIAIMYCGAVEECGTPGRVLSYPQSDYTRQLIRDVPRLEVHRS